MRLHLIDDGVNRTPDERTVTRAPIWMNGRHVDRESIATERAKSSTDEPAIYKAPRTATIVAGQAYDFTTDMFGNETNIRAIRLETDPDGPLTRRVSATSVGAARKSQKSANRRVTRDMGGRPTADGATTRRNSVNRNADVDSFIRNTTGFTGTINATMRRAARDAMAHAASVAAYVADAN